MSVYHARVIALSYKWDIMIISIKENEKKLKNKVWTDYIPLITEYIFNFFERFKYISERKYATIKAYLTKRLDQYHKENSVFKSLRKFVKF